jgi:hypothetical protein
MKQLLTSFGFMLIGLAMHAQLMDCPSLVKSRTATYPYTVSELAKSIQCSTGNNYRCKITLSPEKEYRISFYASSIFDNHMSFQIVDSVSKEILLDRPGETKENKKGESVLRPYMDFASGKTDYPHFDFKPCEIQHLWINIKIPVYKYQIVTGKADGVFLMEDRVETITEDRKGCVTIFIQEKLSDEYVENLQN